MLSMLLLLTALDAQQSGSAPYAPEQAAGGAIREIISAQAYHKSTFPQRGYACTIERLVEVQALGGVWSTGTRVDGYTFKLWCEHAGTPQATYRASATPVKRTKGSTLAVCADDTNVPRTIDGDVKACFDKGVPLK